MTFLDGSGIDFDRAVTVIDPANSHLFITFMLDDEDNFRKWCEAREFSSRDSSGYTIYKTRGEVSIAVKNSQAWVILGYQKGKEADYIKSLYTAAEKALCRSGFGKKSTTPRLLACRSISANILNMWQRAG